MATSRPQLVALAVVACVAWVSSSGEVLEARHHPDDEGVTWPPAVVQLFPPSPIVVVIGAAFQRNAFQNDAFQT